MEKYKRKCACGFVSEFDFSFHYQKIYNSNVDLEVKDFNSNCLECGYKCPKCGNPLDIAFFKPTPILYALTSDVFELIRWTGDNFLDVDEFVSSAASGQFVELIKGELFLIRGFERFQVNLGDYITKDVSFGGCDLLDMDFLNTRSLVSEVSVKPLREITRTKKYVGNGEFLYREKPLKEWR